VYYPREIEVIADSDLPDSEPCSYPCYRHVAHQLAPTAQDHAPGVPWYHEDTAHVVFLAIYGGVGNDYSRSKRQ
jgi:hypothetical protein